MATVDQLLVQIDASTELLRRELQRGSDEVAKFRSGVEGQVNKVGDAFDSMSGLVKKGLGVFGVSLTLGYLKDFAESAISTAKHVGEVAAAVDLSTDRFQRLQRVFADSGVAADEFENAMVHLSRGFAEFQQRGTGPAANAIRQLGLEQDIVSGRIRTLDQFISALSDRFASFQSATEGAAIAQELFGRGGQRLIEGLRKGSAAIDDAAAKVSTIFSREDIENAKEFDTMVSNLSQTIGVTLKSAFIKAAAAAKDFFNSLPGDTDSAKWGVLGSMILPNMGPLGAAIAGGAALGQGLSGAGAVAAGRGAAPSGNFSYNPMTGEYTLGPQLWQPMQPGAGVRAPPFPANFLGAGGAGLGPGGGVLLPGAQAAFQKPIWAEIKESNDQWQAELELKQELLAEDKKRTEEFNRQREEHKQFLDSVDAEAAMWAKVTDLKGQTLKADAQLADMYGRHKEAAKLTAQAIQLAADQEIRAWQEVATKTPEFAQQAALAIQQINQRTAIEIETSSNVALKRMKEFADQFTATFESRGIQAILQGDLHGALRGLAQDFADLVLRLTVLQPLAEATAGWLSGMAGGLFGSSGIGAAVGAATNPFGLAAGGPVTAGHEFLVGERGPELFVPSTAGTIVPHGALGTTVVQNFYNQVGLPPQWDAQLTVAGQMAAQAAYEATVSRMNGRR